MSTHSVRGVLGASIYGKRKGKLGHHSTKNSLLGIKVLTPLLKTHTLTCNTHTHTYAAHIQSIDPANG